MFGLVIYHRSPPKLDARNKGNTIVNFRPRIRQRFHASNSPKNRISGYHLDAPLDLNDLDPIAK